MWDRRAAHADTQQKTMNNTWRPGPFFSYMGLPHGASRKYMEPGQSISPTKKLAQLQELLENRLISAKEFDARKQQVLDSIVNTTEAAAPRLREAGVVPEHVAAHHQAERRERRSPYGISAGGTRSVALPVEPVSRAYPPNDVLDGCAAGYHPEMHVEKQYRPHMHEVGEHRWSEESQEQAARPHMHEVGGHRWGEESQGQQPQEDPRHAEDLAVLSRLSMHESMDNISAHSPSKAPDELAAFMDASPYKPAKDASPSGPAEAQISGDQPRGSGNDDALADFMGKKLDAHAGDGADSFWDREEDVGREPMNEFAAALNNPEPQLIVANGSGYGDGSDSGGNSGNSSGAAKFGRRSPTKQPRGSPSPAPKRATAKRVGYDDAYNGGMITDPRVRVSVPASLELPGDEQHEQAAPSPSSLWASVEVSHSC